MLAGKSPYTICRRPLRWMEWRNPLKFERLEIELRSIRDSPAKTSEFEEKRWGSRGNW